MKSGIVTRDLTKAECPWLKSSVLKRTVVFEFDGLTYGIINEETGVAVCLTTDAVPIELGGCTITTPPHFFQVPKDSVTWYPR